MTDKDTLYKNLEFVSNAYFVAEGAFPLWEAVFALIVGQILIAYFSLNVDHYQKIVLAFLGLILSLIWLILVSLNYLNAEHMNKEMLKIRRCLIVCDPSTTLIWPWPLPEDKKTWTRKVITTGRLPEQKQEPKFDPQKDKRSLASIYELLKSTWFYRKLLPAALVVVWILLVIWQVLRIITDP